MSRPRIVEIGLVLGLLLLAGCATPRLTPLANGVVIDPERRSAARTEAGVTVTVQASAWQGTPTYLERYVTPFYVVVQNDTATGVSFSDQDLALFDEQRTQYNPLRPETVAQILRAGQYRAYPYAPYFFHTFGFHHFHPFHFHHFHPLFFHHFYPIVPAYYPSDDVFTQALLPGVVRPQARLRGFVYFRKLPAQVQRVIFQIGYDVQGEPGRRELSFPFALEPGRTRYPGE